MTAFPTPAEHVRISVEGGSLPQFSRDGREILFIAPDNKMMSAAVDTTVTPPRVGVPRPLFDTHAAHPAWTMSADGTRFLINTRVEEDRPAPLTLFVNWIAAVSSSSRE